MITQPLRPGWKIDEDKGFIPDQIKERVDTEGNLAWATRNEMEPKEFTKYRVAQGRDYLLTSKNRWKL